MEDVHRRHRRARTSRIRRRKPSSANSSPAIWDLFEVLQGSQGALYGADAIAGVVDISTLGARRKGIHQRIYGEGGSRSTFLGGYSLNSAYRPWPIRLQYCRPDHEWFLHRRIRHREGWLPEFERHDRRPFRRKRQTFALRERPFDRSNTDFDDGFGPPPDFWSPTAVPIPNTTQAAGRVGADFKLFDGRLSNTIALQYSGISRDSVNGFGSTFRHSTAPVPSWTIKARSRSPQP